MYDFNDGVSSVRDMQVSASLTRVTRTTLTIHAVSSPSTLLSSPSAIARVTSDVQPQHREWVEDQLACPPAALAGVLLLLLMMMMMLLLMLLLRLLLTHRFQELG